VSRNPTSKPPLDIAHVLFIDIVGYSKLRVRQQTDALHELNAIVSNTDAFRHAEAEQKLLRLPTGDGMALVFRNNPEAPAHCALEISQALKSHPHIELRMGIHSGPVQEVTDVNDRTNVAGAGINMAQRVMDCGDAGHILLSKRVAEDLEHDDYWQPMLQDLGECELKHGVRVHICNLYTKDLGNAQLPHKFKSMREPHVIAATRQSSADSTSPPPSGLGRRNLGALLLAGAVILTLCAYFFLSHSTPAIVDKSIAVLPFDNFSDDKENEHFADGVHDDVLTSLSKIDDLKVISRTSVMQYRAKAHNVRAIAQELGVSAIVEGSLRRSGNRIRLVVQLIDALHDRHMWAQEYDRDLTDVFAIQSALAQEIAAQLKAKLSPAEATRIKERPTTNKEAYDLYLQAHAMYSLPEETLDTLQRVEELYQKATQLDPSFTLAFARLSHIESWIYYLFDPTPERLAKATTAATEAMRQQPDLPESHLAAGYVAYYGNRDYARALAEFEIARAGLPNDPGVLVAIASIERRQGKWKEAIADFEKAASLSPGDPIVIENLALTYEAVRDFAAAAKTFDRAVALVPNSFEAKSLRARVEMEWKGDLTLMRNLLTSLPPNFESFGMVALARFNLHFFERNFDEALAVLRRSPLENLHGQTSTPLPKSFLAAQVYRLIASPEKARAAYDNALPVAMHALEESPQDAARHALIGLIYAGLGRKEDALREGGRAMELLPESKDAMDGPVLVVSMARIYAITGDAEHAIDLLEHSLQTPAGLTVHEIRMDPTWDVLRQNQRFQRLIK
jgi:TolB-like protein/Flp pilus assembly protein TadD/class 3 adenylate cyclase